MLRIVTIVYFLGYIAGFYLFEPAGLAQCLLGDLPCERGQASWLVANFVASTIAAVLLHVLLRSGKSKEPAALGVHMMLLVATIYSTMTVWDNCAECDAPFRPVQVLAYLATCDPFRGIATIATVVFIVTEALRLYQYAFRKKAP